MTEIAEERLPLITDKYIVLWRVRMLVCLPEIFDDKRFSDPYESYSWNASILSLEQFGRSIALVRI